MIGGRAHIRRYLGIGCIVLIAFAVRLYDLAGDSLWEDEIFTATQSVLPAGELLAWTAGDIHPPGYYLVVGWLARGLGWAGLSPSALTDWWWRFPSVLAGTLAVVVTYRLGRELLGWQVGLGGALLLALSPVAVQYSQEARMHALFLLCVAFSTWMLERAIRNPGQVRWWLAYALATAVSLYTLYLAFVVLPAQGVWVVLSRQPDASERQFGLLGLRLGSPGYRMLCWLVSVWLAFVLYLPWWPALIGTVSRRIAVSGVEPGVGPALAFFEKALHALGPAVGWPAWLFFGLWIVGLISLVAQRKWALAVFGGLWLALPLALPLVLGDPRALQVRYVFLLSIYLLLVAHGVSTMGGRCPAARRRLAVGALLALALISLLYLPSYYRRTKPDWRAAAAYLEARTMPGDVIVTGPLFDVGRYLDYYYDGPAELMPPAALVASLPERLPSMRVSGGRVWVVTRFQPKPMAAVSSVPFAGLNVLEPLMPVYDQGVLEQAMVGLMQQAVAAAPDWAARMSAGGVMDPNPHVARAAAYLFLGDVYRVAGRLPEAVSAYEAMVADSPASAGGYVTLAEAYEATGRLQAAMEMYQQAVALNPAWQGSSAEVAASLAQSGRLAEALAAYRQAVK